MVSDVSIGDYQNGHDIQTSHYTANRLLGWAGLYEPLQRISHMDKVIETDINQVIKTTPDLVRRAVRSDLLKVYHQVKNK